MVYGLLHIKINQSCKSSGINISKEKYKPSYFLVLLKVVILRESPDWHQGITNRHSLFGGKIKMANSKVILIYNGFISKISLINISTDLEIEKMKILQEVKIVMRSHNKLQNKC
jgi:hypothetical protein